MPQSRSDTTHVLVISNLITTSYIQLTTIKTKIERIYTNEGVQDIPESKKKLDVIVPRKELENKGSARHP